MNNRRKDARPNQSIISNCGERKRRTRNAKKIVVVHTNQLNGHEIIRPGNTHKLAATQGTMRSRSRIEGSPGKLEAENLSGSGRVGKRGPLTETKVMKRTGAMTI